MNRPIMMINDNDLVRLYDFIEVLNHDEVNDIMEKLEYMKKYIEISKKCTDDLTELNERYLSKNE